MGALRRQLLAAAFDAYRVLYVKLAGSA